MWLGYFEEFPDCLTQGETLAELEANLRDLYRDVTAPAFGSLQSPLPRQLELDADHH